MSSTRITYRQRPGATPEAELTALSAIYELCIRSHVKKEAARDSRPYDAERKIDAGARTSLPR
jgi:hypothetical protein